MSEYIVQDGELYHYGVLGMKWGVRRGRSSKAFYKATKKLDKLKTQSAKNNLAGAKLQSVALKKESRARNERQYKKARKMQFKANKYNLKSAKLQKKAMKWEQKMQKVFAETKVSDISPEYLDKGRQYAYMLLQDEKR